MQSHTCLTCLGSGTGSSGTAGRVSRFLGDFGYFERSLSRWRPASIHRVIIVKTTIWEKQREDESIGYQSQDMQAA